MEILQEVSDMSEERVCRRCNVELVHKPNEYGSGNKYECPECHRIYDLSYEPLTVKDGAAIALFIFMVLGLPILLALFARYFLSVNQAIVFVLIIFIGIPALIAAVVLMSGRLTNGK